MVCSMTAFARKELHGDWGQAVWEIRAVNHRYLEMSFRLPEGFRELESKLRQVLQRKLARGKIDCNLKYIAGAAIQSQVSVNHGLVKSLTDCLNQLAAIGQCENKYRTMDLLRWPGIVELAPQNLSISFSPLIEGFERALEDLREQRLQEGNAISKLLFQRVERIQSLSSKAKLVYQQALEKATQKIKTKVASLNLEVDQHRLEQECVYWAQKMDVFEEIERIETHVDEVKRLLKGDKPLGRRLDFLMQEFNREANTLASKSTDSDLTQIAVDLKVLIEQMREQVQNVE